MNRQRIVLVIILWAVLLGAGCQKPDRYSNEVLDLPQTSTQTPEKGPETALIANLYTPKATFTPGVTMTPEYRDSDVIPTRVSTPYINPIPTLGGEGILALPKLFYTRWVSPDRTELFISHADGKDRAIFWDKDISDLSWSYDGTLLAYVSHEDLLGELCVLDVNAKRELICLEDGWKLYSWHPSRREIAYVSINNGGADVFALDIDSMQQRILIKEEPQAGGIERMRWLDDGRLLLILENLNGYHLYLWDPENSELRLLQANVDFFCPLSVNSQNMLAVGVTPPGANQFIVLFDLIESKEVGVIQYPKDGVNCPAWNPVNPNILAYNRVGSFPSKIQLFDIATNNIIRNVPIEQAAYPHWSPDGQYLAFLYWDIEEHEDGLWVYSMQERNILFIDSAVVEITWRP